VGAVGPDDLRLGFLRHWRRVELPLQIEVMLFQNAKSEKEKEKYE
jgi:hypothetical protein